MLRIKFIADLVTFTLIFPSVILFCLILYFHAEVKAIKNGDRTKKLIVSMITKVHSKDILNKVFQSPDSLVFGILFFSPLVNGIERNW